MQTTPSHRTERRRLRLSDLPGPILLLIAILFGGGGAEGPINNGVIEAVSAVMLMALAACHFTGLRPLWAGAWAPITLLAALLLLLVAQLIPLPPSTWQALPGRELMRASLSLIGEENSWRPLSIDPEATRLFAASLLTPTALMIAILGATRYEASLLIKTVVLAAVISGFIGAFQMALDYPPLLTFYDGPNPGNASGVFANANHHASLLLAGLVCLGAWVGSASSQRGRSTGDFKVHPAWIGLPFLVALVVATGSRAGIGLLALALPMTFGIALRSRIVALAGLAIAAVLALALVVISMSGASAGQATDVQAFLAGDPRFTYLPDILFGMRQYWPSGAGAGVFPAIFVTFQNLDVLSPETLNHAHNEYLEWLTDFGAAGAAWLLLAIVALSWRLIALIRWRSASRGHEALALSALCMLFLMGCHGRRKRSQRRPTLRPKSRQSSRHGPARNPR